MSRPSSGRLVTERVTFVGEDAPDVPHGFVARPEAAEALHFRLAGGTRLDPPTVVLYGPAGVGKTTLIAAVARELAAGAADRGSVLWLNLRDASDLPDGLMRAIGEIERHDGRPLARKDLRGWCSRRACLMVLDDVLSAEGARPLLVGAAGCPTVLIARDVMVAVDLAVPAVRLDAMGPGQSLALIESRVGARLDPVGRASALQLAEAVGGLPLTLEVLCAVSSSLEVPWPALRDSILAQVACPRAPGVEFAGGSTDRPIPLRSVVGWVLRRLPADLLEAFAWLGVLRAGTTISPELAGRLWRVDERAAVTRLRRLAAVGLIAPVSSAGRATANYRLHEAMREEAWDLATAPAEPTSPENLRGLGLSPSGAHSTMLARLRDGGVAATSPVAAALRWIDHLPRSMEDVVPPDDVDTLLGEETPDGENAWYLAREERGDRPGYLQDVDRAWRRADAASLAGDGPGPVSRQCRYALIRASLGPERPDPPPGLIALLVESGRWSTRRAEVAVRRIRHSRTRMWAWTALIPHLAGLAREDAVCTALDEARKQRAPEDGVHALAEVMPVLNPPERDAVRQVAIGLVRQAMRQPDWNTWPPRAVVQVFGSRYTWPLRAAVELVPQLEGSERADLVNVLVDSSGSLSGSTLVELMRGLADRLGPDDYRVAVRRVLDGYRGELSFVERASILLPLGPPADPGAYREGLSRALDDARKVLRIRTEQDDRVRENYKAAGPGSSINYIPIDYFGCFSSLCPLLAWPDLADLREEALAIARGARSEYRFWSLAALTPVMGAGRARDVAVEALRAYRELDCEDFRPDRSLYALLPFLEGPERREAWRLALECFRSSVHSSVFGGRYSLPPADVLGKRNEGELQELLGAIRDAERSVKYGKLKPRPWMDVLPFLSEPRRHEFLKSYPWIDDEVSRAAVLLAALPFLGVPLRPEWSDELLEAARSLQNTPLRATMLAALLPHRSGPDRPAIRAEVLDALRRFPKPWELTVVLRQLVEHADGTGRGVALADLLEAVHDTGLADGPERGMVLMELIAALGPRLDRASIRMGLLQTMGEVRTGLDRPSDDFPNRTAFALTKLAPCLAEPELDDVRREALTMARSLDSGMPGILATIALLLAPAGAERAGQLGEALESARGVDSKPGRVWALVRIAEAVDGEVRHAIAREALAVARDISEDELISFPLFSAPRFGALAAVVPVLDGLERDELARELDELARQLFEEARAMKDDRTRTHAFGILFAHLGEHQRRDLVSDVRRTAFQSYDSTGPRRGPEAHRAVPDRERTRRRDETDRGDARRRVPSRGDGGDRPRPGHEAARRAAPALAGLAPRAGPGQATGALPGPGRDDAGRDGPRRPRGRHGAGAGRE